MRTVSLKRIAFCTLVLVVVSFTINTVSGQSQTFRDDFDGDALNLGNWNWSQNSNGASYSVANGVLTINSGTSSGGGGTVKSNAAYSFSDQTEILKLEIRAKVNSDDIGFWGFASGPCGHTVAFSVAERQATNGQQTGLAAQIGKAGWGVYIVNIEGINQQEWHTYRIEQTGITAKFFIDGSLVAYFGEGIDLQCSSMNIQLTSPSLGVNRTLSIDYVDLKRESLNQSPDCSGATPSTDFLWPAQHQMESVNVLGVTDPEGNPVTITIDSIFQDEPTNGLGDGDTSPDGAGLGTDTAQVRAERSGTGNGRMYHIYFTADDGHGGTCSDEVLVGVRHDQGKKGEAVDDGPVYDSTVP